MTAFYGPVTSEEECTADGRPEDAVIISDERPSVLCENVSKKDMFQ